jgi:hypothetical protein
MVLSVIRMLIAIVVNVYILLFSLLNDSFDIC